MQWCLTKQAEEKLLEELKKDGDPTKMVARGTEGRLKWFTERIGEENAHKVNALFESKMLLKNQINGFKSVAKNLGGNPPVQKTMLDKINNLNKALTEREVDQFLGDLVNTKLGLSVSQQEFDTMTKLSNKVTELSTWDKKTFKFPTDADRFKYGFSKVQFENYVNDLKLRARNISIRREPTKVIATTVTEIPGVLKSAISSFDNSYWGRQGLITLADPTTSEIWVRNFLKSWKDMGKEIKGVSAMDLLKADIYSRPNALNGKYTAGGYGLDVLSEEAFPTDFLEKIPALGKLAKASSSAYNGGALRLRADLADRFIKKAEEFGVNTLNRDEAKPMGKMISSFTGRGSLGKADVIAKELNIFLFSVKWMKSQIDTVFAPPQYFGRKGLEKLGYNTFKNKGDEFAKRQAALRTLRAFAMIYSTLILAKILDPNSTDLDPRGKRFGLVKILGKDVDITASHRIIIRTLANLMPTLHNGEWGYWVKDQSGDFRETTQKAKWGQTTAWDILTGFFENKMSPFLGIFKDRLTGKDFEGNPIGWKEAVTGNIVPMSPNSVMGIFKDPNVPNWGVPISVLLELSGFSGNSSVIPNQVTQTFKEEVTYKEGDLLNYVKTYATAIGVDPETAFSRIFTGQQIERVRGDMVIVKRMPVGESQAIKKKSGADNKTMKLDHTIPNKLGGSDTEDNLKVVTTAEWNSYTPVENALIKAFKEGKVTKSEAQKLIKQFKNKEISKQSVLDSIK